MVDMDSVATLIFWSLVGLFVALAVWSYRSKARAASIVRRVVPWLSGALALSLVAAIVSPAYLSAKEAARTTNRMSAIKTLSAAINVYLAESDEVFPPASHWRDLIHPVEDPTGSRVEIGHAFNGALSSASSFEVENIEKCPLVFESLSPLPNAHGGIELANIGGDFPDCFFGFVSGSVHRFSKNDRFEFNWKVNKTK